jgi:hypothetical protein
MQTVLRAEHRSDGGSPVGEQFGGMPDVGGTEDVHLLARFGLLVAKLSEF